MAQLQAFHKLSQFSKKKCPNILTEQNAAYN